MRARSRRWALVALLIGGVEGLLLVTADLILRVDSAFHASLFGLVGATSAALVSLLPTDFVAALGLLLDVLGAGWLQAHVVVPAIAQASEAGLPALGGVLAAPVYTVVRRTLRARQQEAVEVHGAPPHRIYIAAMPAASESVASPSAAVHEPL